MQNESVRILPEKKRINSLDALRGMAALTVVFVHTLGSLVSGGILRYTPLYIINTGHEAVMLFFILSGYVLIYQYRLNADYTYRRFLIQRFCRIYIPYIVAIAFTIVFILCSTPKPSGPDFVSGMWHTPLSFKIIIKHLILIGNYNTGQLDPVIWSLVHEMRFALLFPILLYLVNLSPVKVGVVIALLIGISMVLIGFKFTYTLGYNNSYGHTVYYFYMFTLGGLLARHKGVLIAWYRKLPGFNKSVGLIIALLLYNYSNLMGILLDGLILPYDWKTTVIDAVRDAGTVIASCYFMIAAISAENRGSILTGKMPLFLGKISYSLYLVHVPVTTFIYFTLFGKLPTWICLILGILMSFLIAVVFNKYVEQWALRIVKKDRTPTVI